MTAPRDLAQGGFGTQFGLSHRVYRDFRPPYPDALYQRIFATVGANDLAVDLGAGTGLVSTVLGGHFRRVCAVEPDPAMAAHLREVAPHVELVASAAEQADFAAGSVDLVTCANAFHWMNGPVVAEAVARWLRPAGVFAGWRYPMPAVPGPIAGLLAREMPRWLAFRDPRVLDMDSMRTSFVAQRDVEMLAEEVIANPVSLELEAFLGFLRSVSFIAAFLRSLGAEGAHAYLLGLADELRTIAGQEPLLLEFPLTLVMARRR